MTGDLLQVAELLVMIKPGILSILAQEGLSSPPHSYTSSRSAVKEYVQSLVAWFGEEASESGRRKEFGQKSHRCVRT